MEAVERKMEITFPYRREIVVKKGISVEKLIEMFPWLTSRNEVHLQTVNFKPNLTLYSMQEFYCNFAEKNVCIRILKNKCKL